MPLEKPTKLLSGLSPTALGHVAFLVLFGGIGSVVYYFYITAYRDFDSALRENISYLSSMAVELVDIEAHEQLTSADQMDSDLYRNTLAPLIRFHRGNPRIQYLYTMRVADGMERFVLDTANDPGISIMLTAAGMDIYGSALMEDYEPNEDDEENRALRAGNRYVYPGTFSDEYGEFITGESPMFDAEGNYLGYLGVDFSVREFNSTLNQLRIAAAGALLLTMLLSLVLSRLLARLKSLSDSTIEALAISKQETLQQKELAESASKAKSEFLSIATHDLKNPIAGIVGLSQIILKGSPEAASPPEKITRYVQSIHETASHMSEVVNSILSTENIEQAAMSSEVFDLSDFLLKIIDFNRNLAHRKQQTLELDIALDLHVRGDRTRMREALENYISNAVKYSPEGKTIRISLKELPTEPGTLEFRVTDQGPGLTNADQEKVFGKFQRLSARPTGGESSTGLGLSIVKSVAEMHGGSVGCVSEAGQGAQFWMRLPVWQ